MSDSSPDLPRGEVRPSANSDSQVSPILPLGNVQPTDDAATVISKNLPRPLVNDDSLNGIRGRKLAHFELIDRIGVGGMAAVLRARDTQLDRIVALKILPPDMALDEENVRRFHQEARSAAKLDHENVARVFFCGEDQRLHFIAFEFVEGDNLRTILERRGRLPVGEALHYMLQVAAGLTHASQRGVVHRDIKPSNIIITPTGRAKLVDMGLARSMEPQHDLGLTQSGVTLGTFDYISPEQALEPREADVRSDIYSLGCTFYHMLTGRPPVPEGTAARKLHHHQHVKPCDPREVVPGLPDDVAVILDRMLAKQPRDRYQTPQQLVHHLLLAARKIGAAEVPEGVLAVEAVVPNPPRYRPLLLAALATVAVVVLILVIGQGVSTPPHDVIGNLPASPKPLRDKEASRPPEKDHAKEPLPQPPANPPDAEKQTVVYDSDDVTPTDLAKWLRDNAKAEALDIRLARDLDLLPSSRDESGEPRLVFKAPKVTIRPKDPLKPVTVRLTYSLGIASNARTGFTLDSKDATIEGVCFLIDAREVDVDLIGLHCVAGGNYNVRRCQFVQVNDPLHPDLRNGGLSSVVVDGSATRAGKTSLNLTECCFLGFGEMNKAQGEPNQPDVLQLKNAAHGGYQAVVRRGPVQIEALNCAFGPHEAVFRLDGESGPSEVSLQHCSVLAARRTTVFALGDRATAALKLKSCLFSQPDDGGGERDGAVFIHQTSSPGAVTFPEQRDNRFHRFDLGVAAAQFKVPQDNSRELEISPWKEEHPLNHLDLVRFTDPAAKVGDATVCSQRLELIGAAFLVNLQDHLADVQPADPKSGLLIGVERLGTVSYAKLLEKETPAARKEKIVDPKVQTAANGVYPNLSQAIDAATNPNDVILIKHNGDLAIKPARLDEVSADVTIRPYPDYHPVLVLGTAADADASMFRVIDGKLQFEGLEFRVEPKDRNFKSQTVATILGNGHCGFKNCVVTLDPGNFSAALAVVSFADLGGMMKSDLPLPRSQPRVAFENCLVRGQGDLVWDRAGRTFDLDAKNTLTVLSGNFLNVELNTEPTAAVLNANLTNVTAYQTGHFLRMHSGKDVKNLPSVQCKTTNCLFVAADNRSLIHLEGLEMSGEQLKDKLVWTVGESGNVYAGYSDSPCGMLDQRPHGEEMPMPAIMADKWKTFTGEMTIKLPRSVKFASPPSPQGPFNRVAPWHFKAAELPGFGADVGTLPKPAVTSPDMEE